MPQGRPLAGLKLEQKSLALRGSFLLLTNDGWSNTALRISYLSCRPMQSAHLSILQCPISQQELLIASNEQLAIANEQLHESSFSFEEGLVNAGADWFFPCTKKCIACIPFTPFL